MKTEEEKGEHQRKYSLAYYQAHKDELCAKHRAYYHAHSKEINLKERQHKRMHCIEYGHGKHNIYGVQKSPFPQDGTCTYCGKIPQKLIWHHWDVKSPNDGIWICSGCHWTIIHLTKRFRDNSGFIKLISDFIAHLSKST